MMTKSRNGSGEAPSSACPTAQGHVLVADSSCWHGGMGWIEGLAHKMRSRNVPVRGPRPPHRGQRSRTGESWHGSVDLTFPEQGFVWVISDLGERKLLDITVGEDVAAEKRLSDTAAGRSIRPRSRPGWIGPWPRASCEICSWCQYMNCRARVSPSGSPRFWSSSFRTRMLAGGQRNLPCSRWWPQGWASPFLLMTSRVSSFQGFVSPASESSAY